MELNSLDDDKYLEKIFKFFRRRIFSFINAVEEYNRDLKLIVEKELLCITNTDIKKKAKLAINQVKNKIKQENINGKETLNNTTNNISNKQQYLQKAEKLNKALQKRNTMFTKKLSENLKENVKNEENKYFEIRNNNDIDITKTKEIEEKKEIKKNKKLSLNLAEYKKSNEDKRNNITSPKNKKHEINSLIIKKTLSTQERDMKLKVNINTPTFLKNNKVIPNSSHNIDTKQKYYVVSGGYPDVIQALEIRGYKESPFPEHFDFNWSLKTSTIDYKKLKKHQIVNHFVNNKQFTSKLGLCKNIRSLILRDNVDIDVFYPRCYDLEDKLEIDDFIEDFKFQKAEGLLKEFAFLKRKINEDKLIISINICEKKLSYYHSIAKENNVKKFIITNDEWALINEEKDTRNANTSLGRKRDENDDNIYKQLSEEEYQKRVITILKELEKLDPQFHISGYHNIWILKPSGLSRGRGIKCIRNLQDLMNSISFVFNNYVIQKYIENPMIIKRRKFDIRQWVTVTNFNPLNVYIYDEPYVRFSAENYNADNVNNLYSHLTNNSIAKYSKNFENSEIEGNMWEISKFKEFVNSNFGQGSYEKIKKQFWDYVILSLESCRDKIENRKNSFEVYGYDFMIDENLSVWLIEINSSPAMDYSTHVTESIVKNGVRELFDIIFQLENKSDEEKAKLTISKWKHVMINGIKSLY